MDNQQPVRIRDIPKVVGEVDKATTHVLADVRVPTTDDPENTEGRLVPATQFGGSGGGEQFQQYSADKVTWHDPPKVTAGRTPDKYWRNAVAATKPANDSNLWGEPIEFASDDEDLFTQYSSNGSSWHNDRQSGDNQYRFAVDVDIPANDSDKWSASFPLGGGSGVAPTIANIYAIVKQILKGGANVTITPDDANNTLTLASSGGGGGPTPLSSYLLPQSGAYIDAGVTYQATWSRVEIKNTNFSAFLSFNIDGGSLASFTKASIGDIVKGSYRDMTSAASRNWLASAFYFVQGAQRPSAILAGLTTDNELLMAQALTGTESSTQSNPTSDLTIDGPFTYDAITVTNLPQITSDIVVRATYAVVDVTVDNSWNRLILIDSRFNRLNIIARLSVAAVGSTPTSNQISGRITISGANYIVSAAVDSSNKLLLALTPQDIARTSQSDPTYTIPSSITINQPVRVEAETVAESGIISA